MQVAMQRPMRATAASTRSAAAAPRVPLARRQLATSTRALPVNDAAEIAAAAVPGQWLRACAAAACWPHNLASPAEQAAPACCGGHGGA
jgi:hypothetical protein